jgi:hypothetical protein
MPLVSPSGAPRDARSSAARLVLTILLGIVVGLGAGCRTAPPPAFLQGAPLSLEDPRASRFVDDYLVRIASRKALLGTARVAISGPDFKLNRPQNVVVARPARLRFEIVGLFEQLAAVIVSDGEHYGFYDASTGEMERGPVSPGLLWQLAKVDVEVEEAVGLLLAAPRPKDFGARAAVWQEGAERIGVGFTGARRHSRRGCPADPERGWRDAACFAAAGELAAGGDAFVFDGEGRLVELRAFEAQGRLRYRARFEDYGPLGEGAGRADFPGVVTIESPAVKSEARFTWKRVMLDGEVADRLFQLPERGTR